MSSTEISQNRPGSGVKLLLSSQETQEVLQHISDINQPDIIVGTKRVSFKNVNNVNESNSRNRINNKTAYLKLHRHSFTAGSNDTIKKLQENYQNRPLKLLSKQEEDNKTIYEREHSHSPDTPVNELTLSSLEKLREKYSPKSFGYPKTKPLVPSKIPVPTFRKVLVRQTSEIEPIKVKITTSETKERREFPIITEVTPSNFEEVQLIYNHINFAEPEDKHFIVTRSSSEDSVLKVENSLADFIMEKKQKEKKRSNSFRRILSGGLFGRDKKKQEEDKTKPKKKDNAVFADNAQNESQVFDRCASHRHTVDNSYSRQGLQKNNTSHNTNLGRSYYFTPQEQCVNKSYSRSSDSRYTEMKGNSMVQLQQKLPNHSQDDYVQMHSSRQNNYLNVNNYIDTSSSSSNTDLDGRNDTYQNALIAQAELRHARENENRKNTLHNTIQQINSDSSCSSETFRSTPPSNQSSSQNVELVKPKALIPINSERPLPNPYHNVQNSESYENITSKTIQRNLDFENSKSFINKNKLYEEHVKSPLNIVTIDDVYGTVFDSIGTAKDLKCDTKSNSPSSVSQISPKSLEASKLRLPPNREKVELQPRIRSPIPQTKVSTDKIIATELLRNKGSPSRSPFSSIERQRTPRTARNTHENGERLIPNAHSTPRSPSNDYIHINTATSCIATKPPPSPKDNLHSIELHQKLKDSQHVTRVIVHDDTTVRDGINRQRNQSESPLYIKENTAYLPAGINQNLNSCQSQSKRMGGGYLPVQGGSSHLNPNIGDDAYETRAIYQERQPSENIFRQSNTSFPANTYCSRDSLQQNLYNSTVDLLPQYNVAIPHLTFSGYSEIPYVSQQQVQNSPNAIRPHTPVGQNIVGMQQQKSPQKQHMFENVEAFYWRELKKLKEKEEQDLFNYRQQQIYMYGYAEDPVSLRRSRSVSPTMQRGRRSLSLPRESRTNSSRTAPETIHEGRPVIDKRPIVLLNRHTEFDYGQIRQNFQRNPNFVRNTFERTTIGPIGRSLQYDKAEQLKQQHYAPIFKRGSLTPDGNTNDQNYQTNKKVSFSSSSNPNSSKSWPTKNGYTQSPPTRRVVRETTLEDDVFLHNSPMSFQNQQNMENLYINDSDPTLYKRNLPISQLSLQQTEPLYGKQVSVSNKVCDIYGQIHNTKQSSGRSSVQLPHHNYGQVKQMGFMYGQVQQNPNQYNSVIMRQSFDHLTQPNFVRGTRLTASVNDMHRRYPMGNTNHMEFVRTTHAPNRPLPPVPERTVSRSVLTKKFVRSGSSQISDAGSGSDIAEIQRMYSSSKHKGFNGYGK